MYLLSLSLICDLSYRTLEQSYIDERRVNGTIFKLFGTAIKRYNHALNFPVRVLQILRTSESSVAPIANGINILFEEYGITTIFSVLLKDLIDMLSVDAADTQTIKNFSLFLTELGSIAPKIIIPHLSILGEEILNLEVNIHLCM